MSESEETEWRLRTTETKQEDKVSSSLEWKKREDLQERVQAKAEAIGGGSGGGGEGSLVTKPEEIPATEDTKQGGKTMKKSLKTGGATRKKESNNNLATISKQLEKQAIQLARIEKLIQALQKSFHTIDKQSNTIKKLYSIVTQLQRRQTHPRHFLQEQQQQQQQKRNRKKRART